jgi:C-terminal processing protease CtpA/Prc
MRGKAIGLIPLILALAGMSAKAATIPIPNSGFEEGVPGSLPARWHTGISAETTSDPATFPAVVDTGQAKSGHSSVRLESPEGQLGDSFGTVTNSVDVTPYRGRRIRLTGAVRALPGEDGQVGLWLRVDRADGLRGSFDNMGDRPITGANWADYSIEADVAVDARQLVFGLLLVGHGQAWLDEVRLEDIGPAKGTGIPVGWGSRPRNDSMGGDEPPRSLSRQGLANLHAFARLYGLVRFFHPSDEAAVADWDQLAIAGVERVEPTRRPAEFAAALRTVFAPVAPSVLIYVGTRPPPSRARPSEAASAVRWHHVGYGDDPGHVYSSERIGSSAVAPADLFDVALGGGIRARIPLAVWRDAVGATLPHATVLPLKPDKPPGFIPAGFDRTTRLAAVAAAWSMFGQFYPYRDMNRVDWDDVLDRTLKSAATDKDDLAFRDTLRRLVAALHDGHGSVPYYQPPKGTLPIGWAWIDGRLVVTASDDSRLKRGDVIVAIDGISAERALAARAALESGSPQWTRRRGLDELLQGPVDGRAMLTVAGVSGIRRVTLSYTKDAAATETKPDAIAELSPGLMYVDIDRVTQAGFDARMPDLAGARGILFDLRGYPRMSPAFLRHLTDRPIRSGHFVSLAFDRPDRPGVSANDGQWTLPPLAPRFTRNLVFITDANAISYSESILSVVAGNHLADIVGSPSAGANGNIAFFTLPGGYQVSWTGMRVTNLDGSRHYLLGVRPTVPVERTIAGVRAGRDELLERAIALVKTRMRSD